MKLVKTEDWFYNMGLVGFNRIIEHSQINYGLDLKEYGYKVTGDNIEFDVELLEEFAQYFFNYYHDKYNSAREQGNKLRSYFNTCKTEDKEKFKNYLKFLKETVKKNNDKIKKLDDEKFQKCDEFYKKLGKVKKLEDLEPLTEAFEEYIKILNLDEINYKITANIFKSVLSTNFFGQVSFLNVCNSGKTLEEQKEILHKDYIAPILKLEQVIEVIKENDEERLKSYVTEQLPEKKDNKDEVYKFIKDINSNLFGRKRKADSIEDFMNEYHKCFICDEHISLGSNYSEGSFIPLALSNENSSNKFWNFNSKIPMCPICKLVLLCTAAGCTEVFKSYMDDKHSYKDKMYYGFVNMETDLKGLIMHNNQFKQQSGKDASFEAFILDSIMQEQKISQWQLQNILYVEFNTDYSSRNTKMNYFNIPNYMAKFLCNEHAIFKAIASKNLRVEIFDQVLAGKDIKDIIWRCNRENVDKGEGFINNVLPVIKIRGYLRRYKEGITMGDKSFEKKMNLIYYKGCAIAKILRDEKQENKIPGLVYRLLNAAKARNKSEFMDTTIRIFMSVEQEVPMPFLEVLKEQELDFEEVAHSFIAGLTSHGEYDKEKQNTVKEGK